MTDKFSFSDLLRDAARDVPTKKLSASEVPSWFDLSRYDGTEELSLRDWRENFDVRHRYWASCMCGAFGGNYEGFKQELMSFFELEGGLLLSALPSDHPFQPAWRPPKSKFGYVQSANLHSYLEVAVAIQEDKSEISILLGGAVDAIVQCESINELQEVYEELGEFLETPFDQTRFRGDFGHLNVEVHMDAPDELILKAFKNWLKDARTRFGQPGKSRFTPAMMMSWTENRILPYIDLCLWAKTNFVHISDELMGHMIFPDDYDKESAGRIRKTVRPKAEFVMSLSVIGAIEAQAEDSAQ